MIERRKCLLITHAATLFSVFAPMSAPRSCALSAPMSSSGSSPRSQPRASTSTRSGSLTPPQVTIAKTADRSVLGCRNDLALTCQPAAEDAGGLARVDLRGLHRVLQRHIYAARGHVPAIDLIADFAGRSKAP